MMAPGLFNLIKVAVSVLIVVLLSLIAERAGPRMAGIASGYPLGAAITLFFYGLENGNGFAARSAIFTAAGLSATVAFVWGYLLGLRLARRRRKVVSLAASTAFGLAAYGLAVGLLSQIPINWVSAPCIAAAAIALAAWHFHPIPDMAIDHRIRLGITVAFFRGGFAALVILAITSAAAVVGSRWAGMFSAFPITMLPLLVIIQFTYRPEHVRAIIKNVPRGLGSLLVYAMVVAASTTTTGIGGATVLGYLAATLYLILIEWGVRLNARSRHA